MSSFSMAAAADALFSSTVQQQAQRDNIANGAIVNGTKLYSAKRYDEAIKEFKRAVSLAPYSANTVDAYNLLIMLQAPSPPLFLHAQHSHFWTHLSRRPMHPKISV